MTILIIWLAGWLSLTAHLLKEGINEGQGMPEWYEWFIPLLWPISVIGTTIEVYRHYKGKKSNIAKPGNK